MIPVHRCLKEKEIQELEVLLCGDINSTGVKAQLDVINARLCQQPTTKGMLFSFLGVAGAVVAITIFLFSFLLSVQKSEILSETRFMIQEAVKDKSSGVGITGEESYTEKRSQEGSRYE